MSLDPRARLAAEALREAVRGVTPRLSPDQLIRRHQRARTYRLAAAASLIVVSKGAVVWRAAVIQKMPEPGRRPSVSDVIVLGGSPGAVAVGAGAVWVANAADNSVSRIDPATNTEVATIRVTERPTGTPFSVTVAEGAVWVQFSPAGTETENEEGGRIYKIDPQSNRVVDSIPLSRSAHGVAAIGEGAVWSANAVTYVVTRTDLETKDVIAEIRAAPLPGAVTVGEGAVWVVGSSGFPDFLGTLSRIDSATNQVVATIDVGRDPLRLAAGAGSVWVMNGADGTVSRVNPENNTVTAAIRVGLRPRALTVGEGAVWVTLGDGKVVRVDVQSNRVTASPPVGTILEGVAADEGGVWVSDSAAGTVTRIEP